MPLKCYNKHKEIPSTKIKKFTFLNADAGAISAPFSVLSKNMGHDEAFIRNPGEKDRYVELSKFVSCILNGKPNASQHFFLTQWGLQHVSVLLARSYGLNIRGVDQPPEVIGVVAAVQAKAEPDSCYAHHCGDADGGGVTRVASFQLHPSLKVV